MPRHLVSKQLLPKRASQAFPLISGLYPQVSLERWLDYVQASTAADEESGVWCIESEEGYIYGLFAYRLTHDLLHGKSLVCENVVAQDLVGPETVLAHLLETMDSLALDRGCEALHIFAPEKMHPAISVLKKDHHRIESTGTFKDVADFAPAPGPNGDKPQAITPAQTGKRISRRRFLSGKITTPPPLRPPWSVAEYRFAEICTSCGDCTVACTEGLLHLGADKRPKVDFSKGGKDGCTFCGECAAACPSGAIASFDEHVDRPPPWHLRIDINSSCLPYHGVECRSCSDHCEPDALLFRPRAGGVPIPEIDLDACNGCGACLSACPVSAIKISSLDDPAAQPQTPSPKGRQSVWRS
ncbi:MAG: ferredoxin-type protein NapF [Rhodospirillaceae bacterium]|nr:ferredoxin-type protein NapF [Rhodospirillaceae bacterium]MBT5660395.1 ferredoxin-type protein NapF [Rhodospirillaceae bacterium]